MATIAAYGSSLAALRDYLGGSDIRDHIFGGEDILLDTVGGIDWYELSRDDFDEDEEEDIIEGGANVPRECVESATNVGSATNVESATTPATPSESSDDLVAYVIEVDSDPIVTKNPTIHDYVSDYVEVFAEPAPVSSKDSLVPSDNLSLTEP